MIRLTALLLPLLSVTPFGDDEVAAVQVAPFVFERGVAPSLVVPDGEVLDYQVQVDIAVLGSTGLGSFQLSSGTEEFRRGIGEQAGPPTRMAWVRGRAMGSYLNYTLDHVIESRMLPQDWPRVIHRDTQSGTENRKHEVMYGTRDGQPMSWYRADRHCKGCESPEHMLEGSWPFSKDHHCKDCDRPEHRVWRKPTTQEIPPGAVDMLSAIHVARAMVREGMRELAFPVLDRDEYWQVTLQRDERREIETLAGAFDCCSIKLTPVAADGKDSERFKGLFGIHGSLSIWLEAASGVPVMIQGTVPLGPFEVDVALVLKQYEGTPKAFRPVEE